MLLPDPSLRVPTWRWSGTPAPRVRSGCCRLVTLLDIQTPDRHNTPPLADVQRAWRGDGVVERPSFEAALSALFFEYEPACSSVFKTPEDWSGSAGPLRGLDPKKLPPYWTLAVPSYYDPYQGVGWVDFSDWGGQRFRSRKLRQEVYNPTTGQFEVADVYPKHHPFLVFEVDYLLVDKDDVKDGMSPEDQKRLKRFQVEAMAFAFERSGFPFSVMVDSGSKSIHVYIRLSDDPQQIVAFRESVEYQRLQELAFMAFGSFDRSVLREGGRVRLMRTPGATRENGAEQTILAVGTKRTIAEVLGWFQTQVSPEALAEVRSRHPIPSASQTRLYRLRIEKWRKDLLRPHEKGERGTHWFHTAKALATAGCRAPRLIHRRTQADTTDRWDASWLWWISAYTFDKQSGGWFFSQDDADWADHKERTRWWEPSDILGMIHEQRTYEKFDPTRALLMDAMEEKKDEPEAELPPVEMIPGANPPPFLGGIVGQPAPEVKIEEEKPKKKKKEKPDGEGGGRKGFDPTPFIAEFFNRIIPMEQLVKMTTDLGDHWWAWNGSIWSRLPEEWLMMKIHHEMMKSHHLEAEKAEVLKGVAHYTIRKDEWVENKSAIAFKNGTLHIGDHADGILFVPFHHPEDRLRSMVMHDYDAAATCPNWENFLAYILPDPERRAIIQEMCGYTLLADQRFQKFFLLLGSGANGKSTLLRILEAIWGPSAEAVSLDQLATPFALGTVFDKRVAVDGDADALGGRKDSPEMTQIVSQVKRWTGGEQIYIQRKHEQGWSVKMAPKLILCANKRPRLMDPTRGVWRRLILVKFDVTIPEKDQIPDFHKKIIEHEMSGIINWMIAGLTRLIKQDGFTKSSAMAKDLLEYQIDMDSVLQFQTDFMRPDQAAGWHDIRPIFEAYRNVFCPEANAHPVSLTEFRLRLGHHGCIIEQPALGEHVYGVPAAATQPPDKHYWAIRGWRCHHPHIGTVATQSFYGKPPGQQGPIQFPGKAAP